MFVVISSGHGKYIRGASGKPCGTWGVDEVDEARRIVDEVAEILEDDYGIETHVFHDNTSHDQGTNLNTIVAAHNKHPQEGRLDVSVHWNAYECTSKEMGTEVLFITQEELAREVSAALSSALGLPDRGPKSRPELKFLNSTTGDEGAILIETAFCDSQADCAAYRDRFSETCMAIAASIAGGEAPVEPPDRPDRPERPEPPSDTMFYAKGTCSWFGGPEDDGVASDEGLAFFYDPRECPHLMLPEQPPGTTGMARRLDPGIMYLACRWDYDVTPKEMLRDQVRKALVIAKGKRFLAYPADWGPHEQQTGRAADLSPALMDALGVGTDDIVEVYYPAPEDALA